MSPWNRSPDLITRHHFWDIAAKAGVGLLAHQSGERNRKRQLAELKKNQALWNALQTPSIENLQMVIHQEISQGRLNPELGQSILQDPSAMAEVGANPELVRAQEASLGALQNIARQGGMDIQSRANLAQVQDQLGQQERGQREALMAQQQRQGTVGSGQGLAAQLMAQQASADRAGQAGFQVAQSADQRALEAIMQSGQMAGKMRTQQVGEDERRALAMDRINKFNTKHRQELQAANRNAINTAREYNLTDKINRESRNVNRRQEGSRQHADAYGTKFNIDQSKVAGQTGANTAIANLRGQKANKMDKVVSGVLGGIELGKDKKKLDLGFEQGGVVPGSAYAGDRVDAQLNSGEMVLNANQQQNLLDLLAGRTNSINPEVPIVEDTMVDNPLDVLANMNNKPSMADGGIGGLFKRSPLYSLFQAGKSFGRAAMKKPVVQDAMGQVPTQQDVASTLGTSVPPPPEAPLETVNVADSPEIVEAAPSNALPMEQAAAAPPTPPAPTSPVEDPISQLADMKPKSSTGDKITSGLNALVESLAIAADPDTALAQKNKKEERDLRERMQVRGIESREKMQDKTLTDAKAKENRARLEKIAKENKGKTNDEIVAKAVSTEGGSKRFYLFTSALDDFAGMDRILTDNGYEFKNVAHQGELENYTLGLVNKLLRIESGAAIKTEELSEFRKLTPQARDEYVRSWLSEGLVQKKMDQLFKAMENLSISTGFNDIKRLTDQLDTRRSGFYSNTSPNSKYFKYHHQQAGGEDYSKITDIDAEIAKERAKNNKQ